MKPARRAAIAGVLILVAFEAGGDSGSVTAPEFRGVAWVAGRRVDAQALAPLAQHHVTWITQTPVGWQPAVDSPTLELVGAERAHWGETDAGLRDTTSLARERGIRTFLKPRVWLGDEGSPPDIYMATDAAWDAWFAGYTAWILHYARLAEELEIPLLSVGNELHKTVIARPGHWARLIGEVREVYGGALTYAAGWDGEFEEVPFWEQLDYVGIEAYFPLSSEPTPDLDELLAGWAPHVAAIDALRARVDRPVLFTAAGYRSWEHAAARPWESPARDDEDGFDAVLQQRLYEALFRTFWAADGFAGVFWVDWHPGHEAAGGQGDIGYSPQNKLAAQTMAAWYSGAGAVAAR
jgi:hypothetical protein